MRKASIDYLRIICMIGVIIEHICSHGGVLSKYEIASQGYWFFMPVETAFCIAVNCFVLITGYNLTYSKFKVSKLLKVEAQVLFFSVVCLLLRITVLKSVEVLSREDLLKCFFPIISRQYWYMTTYFLIVLFSPYFNLLIDKMSQKDFRNLLSLFVLLSLVATVFGWSRTTLGTGYDFLWFIALYFVGAYIKRIGVDVSNLKLFVAWTLILCCSIAMRYLQNVKGFKYEHVTNYNTLFMAIAAICVFMIFLRIDIKNPILIRVSGLGKYVIGAYLISDHPVIRKQLWAKANLTSYTGLGETILHAIGVLIVILVIGTAIEYFRSKLRPRKNKKLKGAWDINGIL